MKSEGVHGGKKEFVVVTPNLARSTPSETLLAMREEMELERKRRVEQMNRDGQDEESRTTSKAKKGVNEELLHLFAFHDVRDHSLLLMVEWGERGSERKFFCPTINQSCY